MAIIPATAGVTAPNGVGCLDEASACLSLAAAANAGLTSASSANVVSAVNGIVNGYTQLARLWIEPLRPTSCAPTSSSPWPTAAGLPCAPRWPTLSRRRRSAPSRARGRNLGA